MRHRHKANDMQIYTSWKYNERYKDQSANHSLSDRRLSIFHHAFVFHTTPTCSVCFIIQIHLLCKLKSSMNMHPGKPQSVMWMHFVTLKIHVWKLWNRLGNITFNRIGPGLVLTCMQHQRKYLCHHTHRQSNTQRHVSAHKITFYSFIWWGGGG
jgi:hypothetical protein